MAVEAVMFKMLGWWYLRDDLGFFFPWKQTNNTNILEVTARFLRCKVYPSEFFRRHKFLGVQKKHLQKTPTADSMDGPQCHVKVNNLMVFPNWGGGGEGLQMMKTDPAGNG